MINNDNIISQIQNTKLQINNIDSQLDNLNLQLQNNGNSNIEIQINNMGIQFLNIGIQMLNISLQISNNNPTNMMNISLNLQNIIPQIIDMANLPMNMPSMNMPPMNMPPMNMNLMNMNPMNMPPMNMPPMNMPPMDNQIQMANEIKEKSNKINITFQIFKGGAQSMIFEYGTTIDEMLKKFLNKVGKPELINSPKICFLFNARQLKIGDKTKIEDYFRDLTKAKVIINDIEGLIGI